jgi:hypothetical protein
MMPAPLLLPLWWLWLPWEVPVPVADAWWWPRATTWRMLSPPHGRPDRSPLVSSSKEARSSAEGMW